MDTVADHGGGGEHEDAGGTLRPDQGRTDRVAVHVRQIAVEHDDVVVVEHRLLDPGGTVVGDVGPETAVAQTLADVVGQLNLVLHDEHPHGTILPQAASHGGHMVVTLRSATGEHHHVIRPTRSDVCGGPV